MIEAADTVKVFSPNDKMRFSKKVGPPSERGCLPWLGAVDKNGYGFIKVGVRQSRAHRIAWQMTHGAIPQGILVCHHCDNPGCVNVDHLFLGTPSDNMVDKVQKGRANAPAGDRNGSRKHKERLQRGDAHFTRRHPELLSRGDRHSAIMKKTAARGEQKLKSAKLTASLVVKIRALHGTMSQAKIAAIFGVSQSRISAICLRTSWAHIA
jgi:hypothetical protein